MHEPAVTKQALELYRSINKPMHKGQKVQLEGLAIEVVEVTDDGRPLRVRFDFAEPLGGRSLPLLPLGRQPVPPARATRSRRDQSPTAGNLRARLRAQLSWQKLFVVQRFHRIDALGRAHR